MNTSENGYQFIRDSEVGKGNGPILRVEPDTGNANEIGYGHDLLLGESYPDGIDEAKAEFLLEQDVAKCEAHLNPLLPVSCTQNEYDALIDFTYECGAGALQQLLGHGWSQVTAQLPRWVHARVKGVETVLPGMVTRRQREIVLFNS